MPNPLQANPLQDTLNVRGISPSAIAEIKAQSRARGLTVGGYIERLVALHLACRQSQLAEIGKLAAEVDLAPVTY